MKEAEEEEEEGARTVLGVSWRIHLQVVYSPRYLQDLGVPCSRISLWDVYSVSTRHKEVAHADEFGGRVGPSDLLVGRVRHCGAGSPSISMRNAWCCQRGEGEKNVH